MTTATTTGLVITCANSPETLTQLFVPTSPLKREPCVNVSVWL